MAEKLKLRIAKMQQRIDELEAKLAVFEAAPTLPAKPKRKRAKPMEMVAAKKKRRSRD